MIDYANPMPDELQLFQNSPAPCVSMGPAASKQSEKFKAEPLPGRTAAPRLLPYMLATILLSALLVLFIQWKTGAWRDDFSATGDEASHFTSAVSMSSFYTSGEMLHPYGFASQYYLHYPKVAFGKWPPVFYFLSGIWFLIFSPSRFTGMLFIGFEVTLLGLTVFWVGSRLLSPMLAFLAAITVVLTPFFALHSTIFMLEPQTATLGLLSLMAFLAVLDNRGWKAGVLFVLATCACILTKANGWALLISAGLGYLWLRKDVRTPLLAVAGWLLATVAVCFPFYYLFVHAMSDGNTESKPTLQFTLEAVPTYLKASMEVLGIAVCALYLLRLFLCARGSYTQREHRPLIVLLVTWTMGPFLFQSIVPASFEIRHLAIAFPCVVLLAFAALAQLLEGYGQKVAIGAGVALLLLTIPWTMPDRYSELFRIAAPGIVSKLSSSTNKAVLLSSNGPGEGRLIACMAALDPKAKLFCVRATKLIVDTDWGAQDYHLLVNTKEEVLKKLDSVPVGYVAIHDMGRVGLPHYALLRDAVLSDPEHWRLTKVLESVPVPGVKETLSIYENSANIAMPVTNLTLDMHRKLSRVIVLQ